MGARQSGTFPAHILGQMALADARRARSRLERAGPGDRMQMISPGWRPPAENRPQWQKKDSAQAANEGWGVNLHISGASAGQRQQPDQWSSEQDPQGSPPKPEQEPTSDAKASTQSTDTGSPKCPQLLIRLPDCTGIQELTRQLEGIKQTSGLGQLLISSRPKDGRWTLLLEGTQASQDKAKAIVKDLLESTQTEAPQIPRICEPLAMPLRAPSSAPDRHRPLKQGGPQRRTACSAPGGAASSS